MVLSAIADPSALGADLQAQAAEAFRQGMDAGYSEGYAGGEAAGRADGYQAGVETGRQAGFDAARAELLERFALSAAPLDEAVTRFEKLFDEYQLALREDVVELVGKVARQVIRCELALKPVQVLDLVEETLAALPPVDGKVEVLLNAEEYARILELAPERAARWRLVADPTLAHGECRVRTAQSEADAGCRQRLDACLARLREQLCGASAADAPAPDTASTTAADAGDEAPPAAPKKRTRKRKSDEAGDAA
nr:flagellar assembly protein FliH [Crenobacter caeni]